MLFSEASGVGEWVVELADSGGSADPSFVGHADAVGILALDTTIQTLIRAGRGCRKTCEFQGGW